MRFETLRQPQLNTGDTTIAHTVAATGDIDS